MANEKSAGGTKNIAIIGVVVLVAIIVAAVLLYHPSSSTTAPTTAASGQVITTPTQNSSAITAAPTTAQQMAANQSVNATAEYAYILSMQVYTNVYQGNWTAATSEMNTIGGLLANVSSSQLPLGLVQGFASLKQDVLNKNQAGVFNLLNIMANATAGGTTPVATPQVSVGQSFNITEQYVYVVSLQIYTNVEQGNWTEATSEINAIEGLFSHIPASHLPPGIAQDYSNLRQDIQNKDKSAALSLLRNMSKSAP